MPKATVKEFTSHTIETLVMKDRTAINLNDVYNDHVVEYINQDITGRMFVLEYSQLCGVDNKGEFVHDLITIDKIPFQKVAFYLIKDGQGLQHDIPNFDVVAGNIQHMNEKDVNWITAIEFKDASFIQIYTTLDDETLTNISVNKSKNQLELYSLSYNAEKGSFEGKCIGYVSVDNIKYIYNSYGEKFIYE